MKKYVKLLLILTVLAITLSLFGCSTIERLFLGGYDYSISDIVMTQVGINEFKIEFSADTGRDDVKVYLTEGFRLTENAKPKEVEKNKDGTKVRFSFTETLNLGEDYYLWLVCGDKEAKTTITAPSMFPTISTNDDGSATFEFKYTYGTAWGSFCDPTGKSVYVSEKPVFDSSAVLIQNNIDITEEKCQIPADKVNSDYYYYSVSVAKEGEVKIISRPVRIFDGFIDQITSISANVTSAPELELSFELDENGSLAAHAEEKLQIIVKTDTADEIYTLGCSYADGKASFRLDLTKLQYESLWYDVLIAWDGAIVMDVPKNFSGRPIEIASSVKLDGVIYSTAGWRPDGAPETDEMLKIYYETDTTKYADEILRGYLVSFSVEDDVPTLNLQVTLRSSQTAAPTLAITAGDKSQIISAEGVLQDDGSYIYSLPVGDALSVADNWYDLRFFVGSTAYEMLKDSCITYENFAEKYQAGARTYEFREWNGMLKLMFTETAE